MSGFVVEIFSPSSDHPAWLAESDGIACVVSTRKYATVFATSDEARAAAELYRFVHQGHIARWSVRPK